MREIKFRAWNEVLEKMYSWNEFLNTNMKQTFIAPESTAMILMQYTGLKDKNGNEIYEGDIIDFSYDMFVGNFNTYVAKGIVIFEEGAFYVQCLENENMTKDESYLLYTINIDTIEIIGNIYNNPELLKGEQS